jgi:hypothetical protein
MEDSEARTINHKLFSLSWKRPKSDAKLRISYMMRTKNANIRYPEPSVTVIEWQDEGWHIPIDHLLPMFLAYKLRFMIFISTLGVSSTYRAVLEADVEQNQLATRSLTTFSPTIDELHPSDHRGLWRRVAVHDQKPWLHLHGIFGHSFVFHEPASCSRIRFRSRASYDGTRLRHFDEEHSTRGQQDVFRWGRRSNALLLTGRKKHKPKKRSHQEAFDNWNTQSLPIKHRKSP